MSKYRLYRAMYDLEGKHCGNEYIGEVITCKDCKHRRENCGMGDHRWCDVLKMTTSADDFCSYGKRREP